MGSEFVHKLSEFVTSTPIAERGAVLRALDASVSLLNSRLSIPHAANWFFENRTVEGLPDEANDFWASRVSPGAAAELCDLVPRFVVLYSDIRQCSLVGSSSARWVYSVLALLCDPPDDSLQERIFQSSFEQIAALKGENEFASNNIFHQALRLAPTDALLRIRFEHEFPDVRLGHCMMRLEIDGEDAVQYWPEIDDGEYNYVDFDVLSQTCEKLGLRHVLPLQLATFFAVIANATANDTESWGGDDGTFFFEEGNIPYVLKQLADQE